MINVNSRHLSPISATANKYYYTDDLNDRTYRTVPLNFWRTRPNSTAKKNYTYLSVDQNIFPVSYTGDKNYEYETNPVNIINNVRSYCFILSIGNIDDNNVVTGITSFDKENCKAGGCVKIGTAYFSYLCFCQHTNITMNRGSLYTGQQ